MSLPSDITSNPMPDVSKDECGNMMVVTGDGLAATFKDGRWQPGFLFSSLYWMNEFSDVTDQDERERILSDATNALREFKLMNAEYFNKS